MGKATVAGLIVERKEVGRPGEFENMSIDELRPDTRVASVLARTKDSPRDSP
jgi:hypothetical protein